MPTYTCTVTAGSLDAGRKVKLAAAITLAHSEVTGAASGFAQVIVHEVPEGGFFVGGLAAEAEQLFVRGEIRAGRSARDRAHLVERLVSDAVEVTGLPRNAVWVYVAELPARAMAEYGHVLPEPGDEAGWLDALPPEDRARLEGARSRESAQTDPRTPD